MPLSPSFFFLILLLIPASYYDITRREIPPWLNNGVLGLIAAYSSLAALQNPWFIPYGIYAFFLPYLLWGLGIIGGGDAKLLTLGCLLLATPHSPDPALPLVFISLSYVLHFIAPDPGFLKSSWRWLLPLPIVAIIARDMVLPVSLMLLLSLKIAELNAHGYAERIPLEELRPHHLVREALKDGDIVELGEIDMFLRRKDYHYIPPLMLGDEEVERIRRLWRDKGREDVRVTRERPAIPAILAASLMHPLIL